MMKTKLKYEFSSYLPYWPLTLHLPPPQKKKSKQTNKQQIIVNIYRYLANTSLLPYFSLNFVMTIPNSRIYRLKPLKIQLKL